MKKEAKVVRLSTEKSSKIVYVHEAGKTYLLTGEEMPTNIILNLGDPQHLYITTDDEIKEGDWCIITNKTGTQFIARNNGSNYELSTGGFVDISATSFKIIATTDKSLLIGKITKTENANIGNYKTLPQIPQTFIEEYCKEGGIDKVLVEFTKMNRCCGRCDGIDDLCWVDQQCDKHNNTDCNECFPPKGDIVKLKTDSHNTITIKPVEEKMYSREEVRELCINAWAVGFKVGINPKDNGSEQDWLKENL